MLQSYLHDNWRILILSGAVRAGKTYIANWIFLYEVRRVHQLAEKRGDSHPIMILAGFSSNSIYTNVITSVENQFGLTLKPDRHGHYHLMNVDIIPAYTGSTRGIGSIRGATAYSAFIDEGSLADQNVFQEIIQRCSIEGSRIVVTSNPGNPNHYLKTDYIDNKKPEARIRSFNFTIDDNTFLSQEYVSALKAQEPSGMFYQRAILGLWVTGEGAIYRDFDQRTMEVDHVPDHLRYVAGVDWGYQHPCSIVVFGYDAQGNYYLVDEDTEQYKEIDYWTEVAHKFQKKYGRGLTFYADSARPEHVDHFQHNGIDCRNGWKSVVPGIEIVAGLMKSGRFFVQKGHTQHFYDEIYNYQWDDKAEDKPVKEADHVMDACRYALATKINLEQQQKYYPKQDRQAILHGMRRFGL